MLPSRIIEPDTFVRHAERFSLGIRVPWYRALPLSSITDFSMDIDGIPVPSETITWTIDGVTYTLDELAGHWERYWYVLDSATVEGDLGGVRESPNHTVHVFVGLYIPYLPNGQGGVLKIGEQDTKTVELKEVAS